MANSAFPSFVRKVEITPSESLALSNWVPLTREWATDFRTSATVSPSTQAAARAAPKLLASPVDKSQAVISPLLLRASNARPSGENCAW
ncbi:MAG: hypothetical protein BWX68_02916 [Verrucomicrobia bacterium ADurb.Bin063]|nr:MAG: hypothetical protein BWX68_02916 [Verrucomicrobia bacterium ADurb.Bin063]